MTTKIELFKFVEGSLITTQTSAASAIDYLSATYLPFSIARSNVETKNELERASVTLTMDITNAFALRHLRTPIDSVVTLTIFQKKDGVFTTFWKGRISKVSAASDNKVQLTFDSVFTSMRRPGLRPRYQINCRHPLYGLRCGLLMDDWAVDVNATDVTETNLVVDSVAGAPDNTFRGGMVRAPDGSLRFITAQVGTTLTMSRNFTSLEDAFIAGGSAPLPVTIYPGCAHTPDACKEKGNYDNYGGFPWIPKKNPIGGNAIS